MSFKLVLCCLGLLLSLLGLPERTAASPSSGQESIENGVRVLRNLSYADTDRKSNQLDLYLPQTTSHPLPLIVLIHGGGWQTGDKSTYRDTCPQLVARGYAAATLNYRLSDEALWPAQVLDCKAAVRWLRAHARDYTLDPNRIIVGGAAAGGHLAAFLAVTNGRREYDQGANLQTRSDVSAALLFAGISDLVARAETPGYEAEAAPDSGESKLLGGPILANRDKARQASPLTFVSNTTVPMCLMQGDKDTLVPVGQAVALYDALRDHGVYTELHILPGVTHALTITPPILDQIDAFLAKTLHIAALPPPPAQDGLLPGVYTIMPDSTSALVLDAPHTKASVPVVIATPNGRLSQKWQVTAVGSDLYSLHPLSDLSLSLTVKAGADKDGSQVIVAPEQGQDSQRWKIVHGGFGTALCPACAPERGLENSMAHRESGSPIDIWSYHFSDANLCWHFQPLP